MSILASPSPDAPSTLGRRIVIGALGMATLAGPLALAFTTASSATFRSELPIERNRLEAAEIQIDIGATAASTRVADLAPGDVRTWLLDVSNEGAAALRYSLQTTSENAQLGAALLVSVHDDESCATSALAPAVPMGGSAPESLLGSAASGAQAGDRVLDVGASERLCVRIELPRDAGNAVQGLETRHTVTAVAETT